MRIKFNRLGRIFDPQQFEVNGEILSHAANPVVIKIDRNLVRIFFNSRDKNERSSVYSIDFDLDRLRPIPDTLKVQFLLDPSDSYFKDGVSLGSHFQLDGLSWIGFMGWINPTFKHWYGTIGKFQLNANLDFESIDEKPWFDLDNQDQTSLSYPAVYTSKNTMHVWYGTTLTWDGGNGEMIHILKEKVSKDYVRFESTNRMVEWEMGESQAFSRPSILKIHDHFLMAFSVRGNATKYRIGFGLIEDSSSVVKQICTFSTSSSKWESEMVEYPYLVAHGDSVFMFYNGNGYGKSGIGLAQLIVE